MATRPHDPAIDHPDYYGGGDNPYEVIKVMEAWGLDRDSYLMTAVIYLARAGKKDPGAYAEDIGKAIWWLNRRLGRPQSAPVPTPLRGVEDGQLRPPVSTPTPSNARADDDGSLNMATQITDERMRQLCAPLLAQRGSVITRVRPSSVVEGHWVIEYKLPASPKSGLSH